MQAVCCVGSCGSCSRFGNSTRATGWLTVWWCDKKHYSTYVSLWIWALIHSVLMLFFLFHYVPLKEMVKLESSP